MWVYLYMYIYMRVSKYIYTYLQCYLFITPWSQQQKCRGVQFIFPNPFFVVAYLFIMKQLGLYVEFNIYRVNGEQS